MRIRTTLTTILALAIAIAFSPLPELQAATLMGPGSQPGFDSLTTLAKAKKKKGYKKKGKKKKGKKRKGKRAKSKGPGKCGTYMYWHKKSRKCLDARSGPPKK
jgi:hypothetical protein